ncbi:MAG TPA: YbaK/EbsC family protein [Steroidobacteraceae bacterium]|jgi:Ala-tRNA(Pro) deacylase
MHGRLLALLDSAGARYRLLEHASEGRTEVVSGMRGHPLSHAAKCIVVMVKLGKKVTRFVLAVVPGDARVRLDALRALQGATYAGFAPPERAEELCGSVVGTVLPFSFDPRLELICDPAIRELPELFFNAARLDRSVALNTEDYLRLAQPRFESIAAR